MPTQIKKIVGLLRGGLSDLEGGFLVSQEFLIAGEIYATVLEQAKDYFYKLKDKDVAAMLCRTVVEDRLKRMARQEGLDFTKQVCRLSCATQQGINELNSAIQNTLPDIELLNTLFPAKWFKVKTAITEQAKKTNFTSYEHYVDICQDNGITKESEQNTLINFLHDLGLVNHFQDRWLRETNVINPQWITEAVYTIINAPQLAGNGKLHREQLTTLLDNDTYPMRKHDYIIELMKKFELCYAINDNEYLLPDLFSTQEPEFAFDDEHALHFILEYDFLPKSIFTRFIVRMHRDILDNTYWRNGVLFSDRASETTALVEVETDSNRIMLKITGSQKREYLAILLFILKDIHRSFSHLSVTEKIGLPDEPKKTGCPRESKNCLRF